MMVFSMNVPEFEIRDVLRGYDLIFKTTFGLFSYQKIDNGTKLLIHSLDVANEGVYLDLGCGYGPVGIVFAKLSPKSKVYFVDRDFVAIEYTRTNCRLNDIPNSEVLLSNGFTNLADLEFDVIAANLPSHISNDMLEWLLRDAKEHLKVDGQLYLVTVSRLRRFIKRQLEDIFGNYGKMASNNMYTVSHARNQKSIR